MRQKHVDLRWASALTIDEIRKTIEEHDLIMSEIFKKFPKRKRLKRNGKKQ